MREGWGWWENGTSVCDFESNCKRGKVEFLMEERRKRIGKRRETDRDRGSEGGRRGTGNGKKENGEKQDTGLTETEIR